MAQLPSASLPTREKHVAEPVRVHPETPSRGPTPLTKAEIYDMVEGRAEFPFGRVIASMSSNVYPAGTVNRELVEGWVRFQTYAMLVEIRDLLKSTGKK